MEIKLGKKITFMTANLMIGLALIIGIIITYYIEKKMLERTTTATFDYFSHLTRHLITNEDFVRIKEGSEYDRFDRIIKKNFFTPEIVTIKIYNTDEILIYHSNDRSLIGRRFNNNKQLVKALKGDVALEISNLQGSEHIYERLAGFKKLLEIYIPIMQEDTHKVIGAYEIYSLIEPLYKNINKIRVFVWISILFSLVILYLTLSWLFRRASNTILQQNILLQNQAEELKNAYDNLKNTQEQLIQSEKLASAGKLAAGVVHEIGNPMASILGLIDLLSLCNGKENEKNICKENLERVASEITRIKNILQGLLNYAKPSAVNIQSNDINLIVERTIPLIPGIMTSNAIKLTTKLDTKIQRLMVDEGQVQQILVNIIMNSIQSMHKGGELEISTSAGLFQSKKDEFYMVGRQFESDDKVITVKIKDTGIGISKNNIEHIFEPFFSTKDSSKGAGLGLAVCHSIIQEIGGAIMVKSQEGAGTVFQVVFPTEDRN